MCRIYIVTILYIVTTAIKVPETAKRVKYRDSNLFILYLLLLLLLFVYIIQVHSCLHCDYIIHSKDDADRERDCEDC